MQDCTLGGVLLLRDRLLMRLTRAIRVTVRSMILYRTFRFLRQTLLIASVVARVRLITLIQVRVLICSRYAGRVTMVLM